MLTFTNVRWSAGNRIVLDGLDLGVNAGELVVLLGASGVGKTSLLRLAAGLVAPETGTVSNGFNKTAMVFQEPRLMPWASARDNVELVLTGPVGARRTIAATWLRRLGFEDADGLKRPGALSGGMQARVAIARAFATEPDLVLMDEPFAALDLGLRRNLQLEVRRLTRETGAAVLFVTHDLTEAVSLADRIVVLAGRPARVNADLAQTPPSLMPEIWQAAAELSHRAELRSVMSGLDRH
jgi:NitT/TauT family transport system ATP-binding protein